MKKKQIIIRRGGIRIRRPLPTKQRQMDRALLNLTGGGITDFLTNLLKPKNKNNKYKKGGEGETTNPPPPPQIPQIPPPETSQQPFNLSTFKENTSFYTFNFDGTNTLTTPQIFEIQQKIVENPNQWTGTLTEEQTKILNKIPVSSWIGEYQTQTQQFVKTLQAIENLRKQGIVNLISKYPSLPPLPVGFQGTGQQQEQEQDAQFFQKTVNNNVEATLPTNPAEWKEITVDKKPRLGFLLFYLLSNQFWKLKEEINKSQNIEWKFPIQAQYLGIVNPIQNLKNQKLNVKQELFSQAVLQKKLTEINALLTASTEKINSRLTQLTQLTGENQVKYKRLEQMVSWREWLDQFLLQEEVMLLRKVLGIAENNSQYKKFTIWPVVQQATQGGRRIRTRKGIKHVPRKSVKKNPRLFRGGAKTLEEIRTQIINIWNNNQEWKPAEGDANDYYTFIGQFMEYFSIAGENRALNTLKKTKNALNQIKQTTAETETG